MFRATRVTPLKPPTPAFLHHLHQRMRFHPVSSSLLYTLVLMLGLAFSGSHAWALNLTVNTTVDAEDKNDVNAGGTGVFNGVCLDTNNQCSLRAAIQEANNHPGSTINLPAGTYTLTLVDEDDDASSGDLDLNASMTLTGANKATTIIQWADPLTSNQRIFDAGGDTSLTTYPLNVTIQNVTIQQGFAVSGIGGGGIHFDAASPIDGSNNGSLTLTNVDVKNCRSLAQRGGGVNVQSANLTMTSCTIDHCYTGGTFSGFHGGGNGGGLDYRGGLLQMDNCTITNNTALDESATDIDGRGGGISLFEPATGSFIHHSTISNNSAERRGGGIYLVAKDLTIDSVGGATVINNNKAGLHGGGIYIDTDTTVASTLHGQALLKNLTITDNTADAAITDPSDSSAAVAPNNGSGDGGGVFIDRIGTVSGGVGGFTLQDSVLGGDGTIFNAARNGAGLATAQDVSSAGNPNGPITLLRNIIRFNRSSVTGGGVYNNGRSITMLYNRVRKNRANGSEDQPGSGFTHVSGTSTIAKNWWGTNVDPGNATAGDRISGAANYTPWIVLSNIPSPNPINILTATTLTGGFHKLSDGTTTSATPATDLTAFIGLAVTWNNATGGSLSNTTSPIDSNGTATATYTAGSIGGITGHADLSVDPAFDGARTTANININKVGTTTAIQSSQTPSLDGQSVTFTATVSVTAPGTGTPTGLVQFFDGATDISAGGTTLTNNAGVFTATFTTSALSVTDHSITATYGGDGNFLGSTSSSITQTVVAAPSLSISDDFVMAPASGGTSTAKFSVTLSAPVSGQNVTVDYASADGTGVAGTDYTAASNTVTFTPGQTTQTISINIPDTATVGKTFLVNITNPNPSVVTISDAQGMGTLTSTIAVGSVIISEFRLRGPQGANDEFIELYNATGASITLGAPDGSSGWALVAADTPSVPRVVVPAGTIIPALSHYLVVNNHANGYSLGVGSDQAYQTDIPDGSGIALFNTSNPGSFANANPVISKSFRLDATGYAAVSDVFREGAGFPDNTGSSGSLELANNLQYSFVRKAQTSGGNSGEPQDTNDNLADFLGVGTGGDKLSTSTQSLGSPGPEGLNAPILINNNIQVDRVDSTQPVQEPPNRVVDYNDKTPDVAAEGTVTIRRKITNTGLTPIVDLQLRIVDQTTLPVPAGTADTRAMSVADLPSGNPGAIVVNGGAIDIHGTTLTSAFNSTFGGGLNSVLTVNGVDGAHPLAPGDFIYIQVKLGIQTFGRTFRFVANFEGD